LHRGERGSDERDRVGREQFTVQPPRVAENSAARRSRRARKLRIAGPRRAVRPLRKPKREDAPVVDGADEVLHGAQHLRSPAVLVEERIGELRRVTQLPRAATRVVQGVGMEAAADGAEPLDQDASVVFDPLA